MRTVSELMALVEDTLPNSKPSEWLFVVSLLQDSYQEGFEDASKQALAVVTKGIEDGIDKLEDHFSDDVLLEDERYAKQVQTYKDIMSEGRVLQHDNGETEFVFDDEVDDDKHSKASFNAGEIL